MFINKVVQALAKNITSDWKVRPNLCWVQFNWNKAVATDSVKLMEISLKEIDDSPSFRDFRKMTQEEKVMINKEDILEIKLNKDKNLSSLNNAYIWNIREWKNASWKRDVSIWTSNLTKQVVTDTQELHNSFPDYKNFFPDEINLEVWMWVDDLIEILQVYKAAGSKILVFKFKDKLEPIEIVNYSWDDYSLKENDIEWIRTVLMPIRI